MPPAALKPLFDRRVPQILGLYLGASWGLVEFVAFLVDRYLLSPHLVTFALVLLALFVPSVCLLAWYHGAPGDDEWRRAETVGISANALGGLVVLYLAFGGKDLGAATTTVSVEDEEGERVERVVPKSQFRKEVALFYLDNESGDPDLDWLRYGLPEALETDLDQDLFVRVTRGLSEDLQEKGFESATGAPMALKREAARKARRDHFLTGEILPSDSGLAVRTELRETETGKLVQARTFTGSDPLELVDSMSVRLRRDLEVPEAHLEQVEDLPAAELTTDSPEAFRAYAEGFAAQVVRDDLGAAEEALGRAVALDSTFALAQWGLARVRLLQNRTAEAERALSAAMDHLYRLPLRYRFGVKDDYYQVKQQPDKRLKVAEMRVEFYPEDVEGHLALADLYGERDRREEALEEYRTVLEIDPGRVEVHDLIGDLQQEMGRDEAALASYRTYADHFPEDADPLHEVAMLFQQTGRHDSAAAYFERAHLLEPDNVDYLVHLARVARYTGDFEDARGHLEEAERAAATPSQRTHVLNARMSLLQMRGRIVEALALRDELIAAERAASGPAAAILAGAVTAYLHAEIGRPERAHAILDELADGAQFPLDRVIPLGRMEVHRVAEDPDGLAELLPTARTTIESFGIESYLWAVDGMRGEVHRLRGECREALPLYDAVLAENPGLGVEVDVHVWKARCHRELGELEAAEGEARTALEMIPADPEALHELALALKAQGDRAGALEAAREAARVYAPADSGHVWAGRVRALHAELSSG